MVRVVRFVCSSRKNRIVPIWGALWRAGWGCIEKVCDGQKWMRHNVGLCRMGGVGVGGRVEFSGW